MARAQRQLNSEYGGIMLKLLLLELAVYAVLMLVAVMFVSQIIVPRFDGTDSNALASAQEGSDDLDSYDSAEMGSGGLVCVYLPGVNYPKTSALDRRVARKLQAVREDLKTQGISPLTFTYGFRTTCQQKSVNPGANFKAKAGTSPHEAGRAVDVNGMRVRPDRGIIISTFKNHGWVWLGAGDPPHFEIKGYMVGEPSHGAWIARAQAEYQSGGPVGGCRGPSGCQ